MTTDLAPAIELRHLVKTFRGHQGATVRAVDGIDLSVQPGEIVAFLGPNGAGKTTTLDVVLGLTEPTSGTARVFGCAPRDAIRAGRVSAVLQTGGLLRDLTVRETVRMIASTYAAHTPVDEVIDRAGLASLSNRRVSKCSGGEQQRLRFALALLPDPDLLILDEPTAGMDVAARHDFWATMHADADAGRTVVFATHYLEEADSFADRIVLVANGGVIADGTTAEIRSAATGRRVSAELPAGTMTAALERLRSTAGVTRVEERGGRVVVEASDSDLVALVLLTELGGHDLEVSTASLDQAFMTLTAEARETQPSATPLSNEPHRPAKELIR
ncbi:MAG: ABC transporter ATP-binding protein [Intrasporangium sp.]|uniref:ABC transporter ATP-binding protein n=1 Tax=Intrasporangium sp. TaxID=1925024 RepID=UPI003F7E3865